MIIYNEDDSFFYESLMPEIHAGYVELVMAKVPDFGREKDEGHEIAASQPDAEL